MTNPSGVSMTVPEIFNDLGVAIDSQYQPAFFSDPDLWTMKWECVKGRAQRTGRLVLQPITGDGSQGIQPDTVNLDSNGGENVKFFSGFGVL